MASPNRQLRITSLTSMRRPGFREERNLLNYLLTKMNAAQYNPPHHRNLSFRSRYPADQFDLNDTTTITILKYLDRILACLTRLHISESLDVARYACVFSRVHLGKHSSNKSRYFANVILQAVLSDCRPFSASNPNPLHTLYSGSQRSRPPCILISFFHEPSLVASPSFHRQIYWEHLIL